MKGNSLNALVASVKTGTGRSDKSKEYARSAEWPKCFHAGCPLQATIKADNVTCTYHYKEHGFNAECITKAVTEFEGYLNKHHQMIFWDVKAWKEKRAQLMGWAVLPATEFEITFPTAYLTRFRIWIDRSIKEKADELYHGN